MDPREHRVETRTEEPSSGFVDGPNQPIADGEQVSGQVGLAPVALTTPVSQPRASAASWILARLSRETSSGRFIPEMDGLRFVAIGMVILFHVNGYLTAKSPLYRASPPQSDWLAQAALVGFRILLSRRGWNQRNRLQVTDSRGFAAPASA